MTGMNKDEYEVLLAILDEGSLTAAARSLGRTLQSVSRAIAALERELNTILFHRTTRRVEPTAACLKFAARIRPALGEISAARDELVDQATQLRGSIRVGAPTAFGAEFVSPILATFLAIHESVRAELVLAEQHLDLAKADIDLAVRLGRLPDSNLRAKQVGTLRRVVFGTPSYFAARGYPIHRMTASCASMPSVRHGRSIGPAALSRSRGGSAPPARLRAMPRLRQARVSAGRRSFRCRNCSTRPRW